MPLLPALPPDAEAGTAPVPESVLLLPPGAFYGRDGRGPWRVVDPQAVIAASRALAAGADLVIDYDHQSDFAAVAGTGGRAPAAGWITGLTVAADGGIRARVHWTVQARRAIAAREYRFLSPVFAHDAAGRVIRLLRAGLTNTPNLALPALNMEMRAMDEIPASPPPAAGTPLAPEGHDAPSLADSLAALFGLPVPVSEQAILDHAERLAARPDPLRLVRDLLGLPADAAPDRVAAALAEQADRAERAMALEGRVTALQSQLTNVLQRRVEDDVDRLIAEGRVLPAERDSMISLAASQPQHFRAIARARPVLVEPGALLAGGPPARARRSDGSGASGLSRDELAVCRQLGLDGGTFRQALDAEARQ
jgi:phage I-like protein